MGAFGPHVLQLKEVLPERAVTPLSMESVRFCEATCVARHHARPLSCGGAEAAPRSEVGFLNRIE